MFATANSSILLLINSVSVDKIKVPASIKNTVHQRQILLSEVAKLVRPSVLILGNDVGPINLKLFADAKRFREDPSQLWREQEVVRHFGPPEIKAL